MLFLSVFRYNAADYLVYFIHCCIPIGYFDFLSRIFCTVPSLYIDLIMFVDIFDCVQCSSVMTFLHFFVKLVIVWS